MMLQVQLTRKKFQIGTEYFVSSQGSGCWPVHGNLRNGRGARGRVEAQRRDLKLCPSGFRYSNHGRQFLIHREGGLRSFLLLFM